MGAQLDYLIKIQDLVNRKNEMESDAMVEQFEEMGFKIDRQRELEILNEAIQEFINKLDHSTQEVYNRVSRKYSRPLTPVINGTCYGCFVALPTAQDTTVINEDIIETCSNCGRIIYWM
jgi:predicted  nucleic acid-binding Zn-ribbon protein